jgi:hypothetical protein
MGCCGRKSENVIEIPFEKVEKFDKLKQRIEQFLSSNDPKEKRDNNLILDLLIKTSNEISDYEYELNKIMNKIDKDEITNNELIEGINQDIKILKDYHAILNKLMKENEYMIDNPSSEIFNEKILLNKNQSNNQENILILQNEKSSKKESIYFKKYIRRNKIGILNMKSKIKRNNIQLNFLNNYEESNKKNENICTSETLNINEDNEKLNLIFELDNGKKIILYAGKGEKFLDVIKKLSEKDIDYNDYKKLKFFDEENDITEKIVNGESAEDLGLTDFHLIQVKFDNKNKL